MILMNLTQQRALELRREARLLRIVVAACSLGFAWGGQGNDLVNELKARNRDDGLALVRIQSDWIYVLSLDGQIHSQRNPRDISTAWVSTDARAVAWAIFR